MSSLEEVLNANRLAVASLIAAAERSEPTWQVPRAPGKWSPSQVTEHVARALDESASLVAGAPSKFPDLPFFLRPLARGLLFNRVLRKNGFPKAKTSRPFDPEVGPPTPAHARVRLETACARFDRACREHPAIGRLETSTFGAVSLTDYARFQEIHVRHHTRQMPGSM
jgi:hypothetical protein